MGQAQPGTAARAGSFTLPATQEQAGATGALFVLETSGIEAATGEGI